MSRLPVAVLGASGTVGQRLLALLSDHPIFTVSQVVASTGRIGQRYGDSVAWRETTALDPQIAALRFTAAEPAAGVRLAFSALDADAARAVEPVFAAAGVMVVSNASAFRAEADVPLVIPEINPDHLGLLERQRRQRHWSGGIVTNPNCATAVLALALAPLDRAFSLRQAVVTTLQAASGAGYPGVASLDLLDNVIPFIAGEEAKIEQECTRLLGRCQGDAITPTAATVSAMVHRVPVTDGHLVSASLAFASPPSPEAAAELLRTWRGSEISRTLPSSPATPIVVDPRDDRPQPRHDRNRGGGMTVTVGRLRRCPVHHLRLVALGHNLVRGAAGAALQNAELLVASGRL